MYRLTRVAVALLAVGSLAGCIWNGGGGAGAGAGGGVGGTAADFTQNYDRVINSIASSDVPTSINARYAGMAQMDIRDGATSVGSVLADLDLALNWTDTPAANETNVWSGNASNFRGTLNGAAIDASGQINVDTGLSAMNRTETTVTLPGVGSVTTAVAGMQINLTGGVTLNGENLNAGMQLGGNCYGTQCASLAGTATGSFTNSLVNPDYTLSGTFYADRQ